MEILMSTLKAVALPSGALLLLVVAGVVEFSSVWKT
jgi:hypothetical protein